MEEEKLLKVRFTTQMCIIIAVENDIIKQKREGNAEEASREINQLVETFKIVKSDSRNKEAQQKIIASEEELFTDYFLGENKLENTEEEFEKRSKVYHRAFLMDYLKYNSEPDIETAQINTDSKGEIVIEMGIKQKDIKDMTL